MKCLFLDLASHDALIACVTEQSTVASDSVKERISDADLIPMVESVLKNAGWTYQDIDHIACIIGPGGFTSLRIGVTYANVLRDQLGIEAAGIHLSDLYQVRCNNNNAYWFHSTKKDQLFVRGGQWTEPTLIDIQDVPTGPWVGELIDEHRAQVASDPIDLASVIDVLPEFLTNQPFSTELLTPWYGRGW